MFNSLLRTFSIVDLSSELGFGGALMEGFNPAAKKVGSEKVVEPEIASLEVEPEIALSKKIKRHTPVNPANIGYT